MCYLCIVIKKEIVMKRNEVEQVLNEYYPKYLKTYISHQHTNRYGVTLVETVMWHNHWVQYCYNADGTIRNNILVGVQWTIGLNRITIKEVNDIQTLKSVLNLK